MTNKKLKVGNVPNLRFPEFSGEWEVKKLGDIGDVKMCRRIFNEETSPVGEIPFFKIGSFGKEADAFISKELYLNYKNKFSFPKKGDILISAAGTIGRTVVFNGEDEYYQDSNIVWIDNNDTKITNTFLFYILQIVKFNTEGGTIQRLYNNILKSTKFSSPIISEQKKIAQFLSLIDERIQTQNKIIEGLKSQIQGFREHLFSQKIRFKDINGNEFLDWENKSLGEICEKKSSNISANKIEDNFGEYLIYGASGVLKKIDFYEEKNDYISIVKDGAGVGRLFYCKGKSSVLGTMDIIKPKNTNSHFLFYLLSNIDFTKYVTGSTIPHIYFKDYKNENFGIPCFEEQTKIANFLSSIDSKIDTEKQILQKLEEQKKYLLQNLFV